MNEPAVERRGLGPLREALDAIAAIGTVKDLAPVIARLQLTNNDQVLFRFGSEQDFENSSQMLAVAAAGGLGLPDRDYYTKADPKSEEIRQKYLAHVKRMLQLLGESETDATREADTIMKIETALAKASLTKVEKRDPYKLFHKMTVDKFMAIAPSFDWAAFFKAMGPFGTGQNFTTLNVAEPAFYKELETQIKTVPLADWKTYLRWHLVHQKAPYLTSAVVQENFDFFRHTLRGVPTLPPRWKRCVAWVDDQLGEALGEEFVRRTFTPDTKQRAADMTRKLESAMEADLQSLDWMGPATKKQALAKLHAIVNRIGYPERYRDYSSVAVDRDDFAGNVEHALSFEARRWMKKVGNPVDRSEWFMTPPTVNAYYDAQMNDINFPAGVLQPPLFDVRLDDAPNYGNTGATIGHELTHGFDDEGRQFDSKGNLKDWWTKKDADAFNSRAKCVVEQYAQYTIVDDIKINSKLTEGEDVADLGGTMLAYVAWKKAAKEVGIDFAKGIDGFTPDQRFFIGMAQWACENERPENLRAQALTNPHSPGIYRINGVVANMPEFQAAFSCKAGQPMVREKRCRVW
jgi:endothelin-converting enzyme/putative endopeptidase